MHTVKRSDLRLFICLLFFLDGFSWLDIMGLSTVRRVIKFFVLGLLLFEKIYELKSNGWIIKKNSGMLPAVIFFTVPFVLSIISSGSLVNQVLYNVLELWVTVLGISAIVNTYPLTRIIDLTTIAVKFDVILLGVLFFLFPGVSFQSGDFVGLFTTKNPCSSLLSFAILLLTQDIYQKRSFIDLVLIGLALYLLISCHAVVGFACLILPLIIFLCIKDRKIQKGYVYLAINVFFILIVQCFLPFLANIFAFFGKDVSLTGRTAIWNALIKVVADNQLFTGFGYGTVWNTDSPGYQYISDAYSKFLYGIPIGAHNNWLEIVLNIGVIGLVLYLIFVVSAFNKIDVLGENKNFALLFLEYATVYGLTERMSIAGDYKGFFVVLLAFYILKRTKQQFAT